MHVAAVCKNCTAKPVIPVPDKRGVADISCPACIERSTLCVCACPHILFKQTAGDVCCSASIYKRCTAIIAAAADIVTEDGVVDIQRSGIRMNTAGKTSSSAVLQNQVVQGHFVVAVQIHDLDAGSRMGGIRAIRIERDRVAAVQDHFAACDGAIDDQAVRLERIRRNIQRAADGDFGHGVRKVDRVGLRRGIETGGKDACRAARNRSGIVCRILQGFTQGDLTVKGIEDILIGVHSQAGRFRRESVRPGIELEEREHAAHIVQSGGVNFAAGEPVSGGINSVKRHVVRIGSAEFLPCAVDDIQIVERAIFSADQRTGDRSSAIRLDLKGVVCGQGGGGEDVSGISADHAVDVVQRAVDRTANDGVDRIEGTAGNFHGGCGFGGVHSGVDQIDRTAGDLEAVAHTPEVVVEGGVDHIDRTGGNVNRATAGIRSLTIVPAVGCAVSGEQAVFDGEACTGKVDGSAVGRAPAACAVAVEERVFDGDRGPCRAIDGTAALNCAGIRVEDCIFDGAGSIGCEVDPAAVGTGKVPRDGGFGLRRGGRIDVRIHREGTGLHHDPAAVVVAEASVRLVVRNLHAIKGE